ncbi:hypothetical protein KDA11_03985 [Candidatus Saccharibacteria bacterium]|nr:hypothetical protein [Candidatus Saccharibacteria bacterium]
MCRYCREINRLRGKGGVGNILISGNKIVLPKERSGPNAGRYTLFGGGREPEDGNCFLRTGFRELIQETSLLTPTEWNSLTRKQYRELFDAFYRPKGKPLKWFMLRSTVILVCWLPAKYSVADLNRRIMRALHSNIPYCWREISSCKAFTPKEIIDGPGTLISAYAKIATLLYLN